MAQLGNILANIGKARMPAAHLPALEPKPLLNVASKAAPTPVPANVPPPELHPQELPAAPKVPPALLPGASSARARADAAHPGLVPREDPTGSIRAGVLDMQRRQQAAGFPTSWGNAKVEGTPAMVSHAAPVQPTIEEMATGTAWTRGIRPQLQPRSVLPHNQLYDFLTAREGQPAYNHAAPWQNLLQEIARPVLTNPALRRGAGIAGRGAGLAALSGLTDSEAGGEGRPQ